MVVLLPACHKLVQREPGFAFPDVPSEPGRVLAMIKAGNDGARSFKGIGKISVWDESSERTTRAAWAGAMDGRLRIEFLALPGQPVAKFIYDGKTYSFVSQTDGQIHRQSASDPVLTQVAGVPVRVSEVVEYLAGGIPVCAHDTVELEALAGRYVLNFRKNWLGLVERIYLDPSRTMVRTVEMYRWGKPVYRAELSDLRLVENQRVPFDLTLSNGDGKGFRVTIDRYWRDAPIGPAMFSPDTPR